MDPHVILVDAPQRGSRADLAVVAGGQQLQIPLLQPLWVGNEVRIVSVGLQPLTAQGGLVGELGQLVAAFVLGHHIREAGADVVVDLPHVAGAVNRDGGHLVGQLGRPHRLCGLEGGHVLGGTLE